MNKQKLIKKYNDACFAVVPVDEVLENLKQLDEPKPVKVQQFVADWIRKCKTFKHFAVSLSFALQPIVWEENNLSDKCIDWLMDANNQETFARAWLDGYEVENEKRHTVVMKTTKQPLYYNVLDKKLFFSMGGLATKFTRKQLEDAGFGWVFDCPGVEIEEVDD